MGHPHTYIKSGVRLIKVGLRERQGTSNTRVSINSCSSSKSLSISSPVTTYMLRMTGEYPWQRVRRLPYRRALIPHSVCAEAIPQVINAAGAPNVTQTHK